jgi:predicted metal-dependent hydrolase
VVHDIVARYDPDRKAHTQQEENSVSDRRGERHVNRPCPVADEDRRHPAFYRIKVWLDRKETSRSKEKCPNPHRYVEGETLLYLGREIPLRLVPDQQPALILDGSFQLAKSARPQAVSVFEAWYKKHARTYLAERLEFFSRNYGFEMKRVRISSAHKRWGSCSAQGTLSFTWRLVKAPPEVIDYVVVHELCHLRELNHSRKFWALVESILPEYKISRMWLKQYGEKLSL